MNLVIGRYLYVGNPSNRRWKRKTDYICYINTENRLWTVHRIFYLYSLNNDELLREWLEVFHFYHILICIQFINTYDDTYINMSFPRITYLFFCVIFVRRTRNIPGLFFYITVLEHGDRGSGYSYSNDRAGWDHNGPLLMTAPRIQWTQYNFTVYPYSFLCFCQIVQHKIVAASILKIVNYS